MNLLIIGNGFDLAHDLKTGYKDFLRYVIQREESLYSNFTKNNTDADLEYFEEKEAHLIKYVEKNVWFYYFTNLYKEHLISGNNWIDFESEISHIVEIFDRSMPDKYSYIPALNQLNDDKKMVLFYNYYGNIYAEGVDDVPKHTYKELIDHIYEDLERLISAFEYYLKNEVETVEIRKRSSDIEALKLDGILSFNYTDTIKRIYQNVAKTAIHYIHGKVSDNDDNNMVLGINEYWDAKEAGEHTAFNCMKKFTQRVINNTGVDYRKWIYDATGTGMKYERKREQTSYKELGLSNVYVFGHSLDITDKDLLKEIFDNEHIIVNVFYRDKIHQSELIAAIVRMITEEEFIRQYNSYPQKIRFIEQQELK